MKHLFPLILLLLASPALFGQAATHTKPVILDTPGVYDFGGTVVWKRQDSAFCYITAPGSYVIDCVDATLTGPAFVQLAGKNSFPAGTNLDIEFRDVVARAYDTIRPEFTTAPLFFNSTDGGNWSGLRVEHCEMYGLAGIRAKRGRAFTNGDSPRLYVGYNSFIHLDGRVSDGNGDYYTPKEAQAAGGPPATFYSTYAVIARSWQDFISEPKAVLIEWNEVINVVDGLAIAHQRDVFNFKISATDATLTFDTDSIPTESGIMLQHNLVYGNYFLRPESSKQPGCAAIADALTAKYDGIDPTKGARNILVYDNYFVNCSNSPVQHASYDKDYYVQNTVVTSGLLPGYDPPTYMFYCSRGLGTYTPSHATKPVDTNTRFYLNRSAFMRTRNGNIYRNDYVLEKHFPAYVMPFTGSKANISLWEGRAVTPEDESYIICLYYKQPQTQDIGKKKSVREKWYCDLCGCEPIINDSIIVEDEPIDEPVDQPNDSSGIYEDFESFNSALWKKSGNRKQQIIHEQLKVSISPSDLNSYRSELTINKHPDKNYAFGSSWTYQTDITIPPDWSQDQYPDILMQFHPPFKKGRTLNPTLRLRISGDQYEIEQLGDSSQNPPKGNYQYKRDTAVAQVIPGKTHTWTFGITWGYSTAVTKIYMDSILVYEDFGPNCFNLENAGYLKFGIYAPLRQKKKDWNTRAYYFDNLIIQKGLPDIPVKDPQDCDCVDLQALRQMSVLELIDFLNP